MFKLISQEVILQWYTLVLIEEPWVQLLYIVIIHLTCLMFIGHTERHMGAYQEVWDYPLSCILWSVKVWVLFALQRTALCVHTFFFQLVFYCWILQTCLSLIVVFSFLNSCLVNFWTPTTLLLEGGARSSLAFFSQPSLSSESIHSCQMVSMSERVFLANSLALLDSNR